MNTLTQQDLERVLKHSQCLITAEEINAAYDKLAAQLNAHYSGLNPLIIVVMNGGLIPAGQLLTRLTFFHRMDYVHASRCQNNQGGIIEWKARPKQSLENEHVLLIDDIFDEGITLKAIADELRRQHLKSLRCCVLIDKKHDRKVKDFAVDFIGTQVADRYIYGCGMDYHGYLRHLTGIYALSEDDEI